MEKPEVSSDLPETTYPGLSVVGASETLPMFTAGSSAFFLIVGSRLLGKMLLLELRRSLVRTLMESLMLQAWWGSFERVTWLSESLLHTLRSS